jgi:hypothetical protein
MDYDNIPLENWQYMAIVAAFPRDTEKQEKYVYICSMNSLVASEPGKEQLKQAFSRNPDLPIEIIKELLLYGSGRPYADELSQAVKKALAFGELFLTYLAIYIKRPDIYLSKNKFFFLMSKIRNKLLPVSDRALRSYWSDNLPSAHLCGALVLRRDWTAYIQELSTGIECDTKQDAAERREKILAYVKGVLAVAEWLKEVAIKGNILDANQLWSVTPDILQELPAVGEKDIAPHLSVPPNIDDILSSYSVKTKYLMD